MEQVKEYLQGHDAIPCLPLLEAARKCWEYCPDGVVPLGLIEDLEQAFGGDAVEQECNRLLRAGLFQAVPGADTTQIRLDYGLQGPCETLLRQMWTQLPLETGTGTVTAGSYLAHLADALLHTGEGITVQDRKEDVLLVTKGEETWRIILTGTPFWLPLTVMDSRRTEKVLAIGPFASLRWDVLYPYCGWEEFRTGIALYDPWHQQKMCLCQGTVPVYVDWFHRDHYHGRFTIPAAFCQSLHEMSLLRFDDEW